MQRIKRATSYNAEWLETDRPQPLSDLFIEQLQQEVLSGKLDKDTSNKVYTNFKLEMPEWLLKSKLNNITGLGDFNRIDIINGCTQFIDNLYMQGPVQTLPGDYRYHERLKLSYIKDTGSLIPNIPLIIAMPFPKVGAPHTDMIEILNEAIIKKIDVHIDGAWVTCCKDIAFDVGNPVIKSVGISLSKGLGLGWNRIGLRWTRQTTTDSVTLMNDFNMNLRAPAMIGLHFIRTLPQDYLWNRYGDIYNQICNDFELTPTQSIYLALRKNQPVGLSPLIRYVAEQ